MLGRTGLSFGTLATGSNRITGLEENIPNSLDRSSGFVPRHRTARTGAPSTADSYTVCEALPQVQQEWFSRFNALDSPRASTCPQKVDTAFTYWWKFSTLRLV